MADPTLTGLEVLRTAFRPLQEAQQTQQAIVASEIARNRTVQDTREAAKDKEKLLKQSYELRMAMAQEAKKLQTELVTEAAENAEKLEDAQTNRDNKAWLADTKKYVKMVLKSRDSSLADYDTEDPQQLAKLREDTQSYLGEVKLQADTEKITEAYLPALSENFKRYLGAISDQASSMARGISPEGKSQLFGLMGVNYSQTNEDLTLDDEIVELIRDGRNVTDEEIATILNKLHSGQWSANATPNEKAAGWLDLANPGNNEGQLTQEAGEFLFQQFSDTYSNTLYGQGGLSGSYGKSTSELNPILQQTAPTLYQDLVTMNGGTTSAASETTLAFGALVDTLLQSLAEVSPLSLAAVTEKIPALVPRVARIDVSAAFNDVGGDAGFGGKKKTAASDTESEEKPSYGSRASDAVAGKVKDMGLGPWTGEAAALIPGLAGTAADALSWGVGVEAKRRNFLGEKFLGDLYDPIPQDSGNLRKAVGVLEGILGDVSPIKPGMYKLPIDIYRHMFNGSEENTPAVPPMTPAGPPDNELQPSKMGGEGTPRPNQPLSSMPSSRPATFSERVRQLDTSLT